MKPVFRASTPRDRQAIAQFLRRTFNSAPAEPYLQPAHMEWKYWQKRSNWTGSRSFLLERDGAIVAHAAAWPLSILTPRGTVSAFHLIDWAADPKLPGAGVSIMKHMAEMADVVCVFGGSDAARRMRAAMGFQPRNDVQVLVKPLRPFRQALTHQAKNWKSPARIVRNWIWSRKSLYHDAHWTAHSVGTKALSFPQPCEEHLVFERTLEEFRYLLHCPTARFEYFTVLRAGEPVGGFCLAIVPGQARLADAWLASENQEDWIQLVRLAQRRSLAESSANEMVAQASGPPMQLALRAAGFRRHHSDRALVYDRKGCIPPDAMLDLQMIHGDMAFWHCGSPLYLS